MVARTKAELAERYAELFMSAGTPRISSEGARSFYQDMIDSLSTQASLDDLARRVTALETGTPEPADRSHYVGWSDDRTIEASDFAAATEFDTNIGTIPARASNGYLWFSAAQTLGSPAHMYLAGGSRDNISGFPQQAGTVDDPDAVAHIVRVSQFMQIAALGGQEIRLEY